MQSFKGAICMHLGKLRIPGHISMRNSYIKVVERGISEDIHHSTACNYKELATTELLMDN